MVKMINATDVRKNWGQFNDEVVRNGPKFVKRNRDKWAALSQEQLQVALSEFKFHATQIKEDDQSVTLTLKELDIVENGKTFEEALGCLAEELVEYANEYRDHFKLYFNAPNRRDHFPYIMNVLAQENMQGVKSLIRCQPGRK